MFWHQDIGEQSRDLGPLCVCVCALSRVRLFVTPWIVTHQAPLSMEFFRREYWNGLPFPPPGDLPHPGIEPTFYFTSCICRQILYRWATWKAFYSSSDTIKYVQTVLILLPALLWRNSFLGPLPYSSQNGGVQTPIPTSSGSEPVCSRYPSSDTCSAVISKNLSLTSLRLTCIPTHILLYISNYL